MSALEQAQRGTNDRLDETNARLDRTNARLDQAVEVLTRLVRVVAVQNSRVNQNFSRLTAPQPSDTTTCHVGFRCVVGPGESAQRSC